MKSVLFTLTTIFSLLFFINISLAVSVTDCQTINSAGYYELVNPITALIQSEANSCIVIKSSNVFFNMKDYTITGKNNTNGGVYTGILIESGNSNITIQNGIVQNFTYESAGSGLSVICGVSGCSKINIINLKLIDNNIGLNLLNVSDSNFQVANDNPSFDSGLTILDVSNSTFSVFSRSKTYAGIFTNLTYSKIVGHFDTNIIETENQTTLLGYIDIFHLLPPTVTTKTIQTQSKGIGLMLWNTSNSIIQDVSGIGLIQGVSAETSSNNIFARIDLALSGKYIGGKFGGLWLGQESYNNQICEIKGLIVDDCNQLLLSSSCSKKNNTFYDTCSNVFNASTLGTKQSIQDLYLTPLAPNLKVANYPFVTFLTTPFFLVMLIITSVSILVAKITKNGQIGVYTMVILVLLTSMVFFSTLVFGLIFVVIIGFILMKTGVIKR
jgi:hypothetical protein